MVTCWEIIKRVSHTFLHWQSQMLPEPTLGSISQIWSSWCLCYAWLQRESLSPEEERTTAEKQQDHEMRFESSNSLLVLKNISIFMYNLNQTTTKFLQYTEIIDIFSCFDHKCIMCCRNLGFAFFKKCTDGFCGQSVLRRPDFLQFEYITTHQLGCTCFKEDGQGVPNSSHTVYKAEQNNIIVLKRRSWGSEEIEHW